MRKETEIGGPNAGFLSTRWTELFDARNPASPQRRESLDHLIRTYWKPVYLLIRRRGHPVDAAKDLTQGFFAAFLEREFLQYVDPCRGRFRIFLKTALDHYLADEYHRARALKRGGDCTRVPFDFQQAETEVGKGADWEGDPDRLFRRKWAIALLKQALEALRRECDAEGSREEFRTLETFLTPGKEGAPSYAEAARSLGLSETQLNNRLHRLRERYRDAILQELRGSTQSDAEAREELGDLFSSLSA